MTEMAVLLKVIAFPILVRMFHPHSWMVIALNDASNKCQSLGYKLA